MILFTRNNKYNKNYYNQLLNGQLNENLKKHVNRFQNISKIVEKESRRFCDDFLLNFRQKKTLERYSEDTELLKKFENN